MVIVVISIILDHFHSFHQQLPAYDIAKEKIKSLGLGEVRSNL